MAIFYLKFTRYLILHSQPFFVSALKLNGKLKYVIIPSKYCLDLLFCEFMPEYPRRASLPFEAMR